MNNKLIGTEKNIIFYNDEEGNIKIEVLLENEDVWLNTEAIASLFNVKRPIITKHINNIYNDNELIEENTCSKLEHVAKNYLDEKEIKNLNNLVNLFLDIAENNAERNIPMYMNDWKKEVENALTLFHYEVLNDKGKISHKDAVQKALSEYEKYRIIQDKNYVSDFDKLLLEAKEVSFK